MTVSHSYLVHHISCAVAAVCATAVLGVDLHSPLPGPDAATAQVSVSNDTIPVALLDEVAALARGHRTGATAFAVVCASPTRSVGIFDTESNAVAAATEEAGPCYVRAVVTQAIDTSRVISTTLARVLAEAADGYRTGMPIWIVASVGPDYDIRGVFDNTVDALAAIPRGDTTGYEVFGPFVSDLDFGLPPMFFGLCHSPPTRYRPCYPVWEGPSVPMADIELIRVTAFADDRELVTWEMTPDEVDAIFFSLSAVDKFVILYYTSVFGLSYAEDLRRSLEQFITGR